MSTEHLRPEQPAPKNSSPLQQELTRYTFTSIRYRQHFDPTQGNCDRTNWHFNWLNNKTSKQTTEPLSTKNGYNLKSVPGYCSWFLMRIPGTHTCQRNAEKIVTRRKFNWLLHIHFIYFYPEKLTKHKQIFMEIYNRKCLNLFFVWKPERDLAKFVLLMSFAMQNHPGLFCFGCVLITWSGRWANWKSEFFFHYNGWT